MTAARQVLGERGERIAEDFLKSKGWTILDRRFRSGHRDIDLVVARKEGTARLIVFVEVKTRVRESFGGPLGAVHWRTQRDIAHAARDWMSSYREPGDSFRFDVVGIIYGVGSPEVCHIENAFTVR